MSIEDLKHLQARETLRLHNILNLANSQVQLTDSQLNQIQARRVSLFLVEKLVQAGRENY